MPPLPKLVSRLPLVFKRITRRRKIACGSNYNLLVRLNGDPKCGVSGDHRKASVAEAGIETAVGVVTRHAWLWDALIIWDRPCYQVLAITLNNHADGVVGVFRGDDASAAKSWVQAARLGHQQGRGAEERRAGE